MSKQAAQETWRYEYDEESKMYGLWWTDERGAIGEVYTKAYADRIIADHAASLREASALEALGEEIKTLREALEHYHELNAIVGLLRLEVERGSPWAQNLANVVSMENWVTKAEKVDLQVVAARIRSQESTGSNGSGGE